MYFLQANFTIYKYFSLNAGSINWWYCNSSKATLSKIEARQSRIRKRDRHDFRIATSKPRKATRLLCWRKPVDADLWVHGKQLSVPGTFRWDQLSQPFLWAKITIKETAFSKKEPSWLTFFFLLLLWYRKKHIWQIETRLAYEEENLPRYSQRFGLSPWRIDNKNCA